MGTVNGGAGENLGLALCMASSVSAATLRALSARLALAISLPLTHAGIIQIIWPGSTRLMRQSNLTWLARTERRVSAPLHIANGGSKARFVL